MKLFSFIILFSFSVAFAQNTIKERGVLIRSNFDTQNSPQIELKWQKDTNALYYNILRKERNQQKFSEIARIDSSINEWTDTNIFKGVSYEYQIENYRADYSAYGFINCGIELTLIEKRGTFVVFVDNTINSSLSDEIKLYKSDLEGDGWNVVIDSSIPRAEVFSAEKVKYLKSRFDTFKQDYPDFSAALLVGRLPVAYTGTIAFDGHSDHKGAWPSDLYYGVFSNEWTDTATQVNATEERNKNIPKDYKFDQIYHNADVEIAIGRVDAYNLPFFKDSEIELIRNYFSKNHKFRQKLVSISDSAIISNRFDIDYKESFAAMGWMNFTALFADRISTAFAREAIRTNSYLWMYCDGPGSYTGTWDVAYSEEYANFPFNAVFSAIFGSYNGDWDSENNLLRSAIFGKPNGLNAFWAARPFWFLHTLGMGESFADVTLLSQNNFANDYPAISPYYRRATHIALMGDPSLKMRYIAPPIEFKAILENNIVNLKWQNSSDSILGYNIYRRNIGFNTRFEKINDTYITNNFFIDETTEIGEFEYLVRGVNLVKSESGTYFDMSQGAFSNNIFLPQLDTNKLLDWKIGPNPASEYLNISIFSKDIQDINIELFDVSGKRVLNEALLDVKNYKFYKLDLKNGKETISKGVYFLKFTNENIQIITKISII